MDATEWLLDSDPAIRWQALRDLADAPPDVVARERARVAREGWGAQILAAQDPDGRWGGGTFFPRWVATADTLHALRAVVDALTVELQFEDTLGQRLGHAAGKIDAAGVALSEARSLMGGAADGDADSTGHALTVLARTLDSIRNAMDPGAPQPASGGAIELF